jgi:hypothetical protein
MHLASVSQRDLAVSRSLDVKRLRKQQRIQAFLDAGMDLLRDSRPGEEFVLQQVVERAGHSMNCFYHYFSGRNEFCLALFDEVIVAALNRLETDSVILESPVARLESIVCGLYRMCLPAEQLHQQSDSNCELALIKIFDKLFVAQRADVSSVFSPLVSLLERVLDDTSKLIEIRADLDRSELAGVLLTTIMFSAAHAGTISGNHALTERDQAATNFWEFVGRGIVSPPLG